MPKMDYEKFKQFSAENIRDFLPKEYEDARVEVQKIRKIGDDYDGLIVRKEGSEVSPAVNLNKMYDEYLVGKTIGTVLADMAEIVQTAVPIVTRSMLTDYDSVKERLFIRVCNTGDNEALLENVPHREMDGIAMTYHVKIGESDNSLMSSIVTNDAMRALGVDEMTLHEDAIKNGCRLFPPVIERLEDRVFADSSAVSSREPRMLVVTNERTVNGAATMFYEGIQDEIAEKLHGSYFVIPSSTNEMLAIKDTGQEDYMSLEKLLRHMNTIGVAKEELLSYNVFHYDAEDKIFEKASGYDDRMVEKMFDKAFFDMMKRIDSDSKTDADLPKNESKNRSFSMKM